MAKKKLYPVRFEIRLTKEQEKHLVLKSSSWGLTASQMIRNWIDEDAFLSKKK